MRSSNNIVYTVDAVCKLNDISLEILSEMVKCGIAHPYGLSCRRWSFSQQEFENIQVAAGYLHGLQLDPAAAVVAFEISKELAILKHSMGL